jgi:S1-C subfamily serine protease
MALDLKSANLLARARRAFGEHEVGEAVAKFRAIIGPPLIPLSEPDAQSAWNKLENGEDPTPLELASLELVIRLMRPAPLSENGKLADLPDDAGKGLFPAELKDLWTAFRQKANPLLFSVARIETRAHELIGTGFLVADRLLATNRHVLGALTSGSEVLAPGQARALFKFEYTGSEPDEHTADLDGVAAVHPTLDMVLLRVAASPRPVLEIEPVPAQSGERMVAIGYPGRDPFRNPAFLEAIYQGKYEVKRAALGEVLDGAATPVLFHDASTTGGNSGSPLLSLLTGRVVGIHRAGFFMYRNEAIDAQHVQKFIHAST